MEHPLNHALKHAGNLTKQRNRASIIYLIGCNEFVKVGIANNPVFRLCSLQVGCPYELRLLATFRTDSCCSDEAKFHRMWKKYELRGEWFKVPEVELCSVCQMETLKEVFDTA